MKKALLILLLIFAFKANAQDDKTVTIVVSGQGKTQDEAKQNALRSAIEQAFGAFVSSKTEILNDSLIKDEIVSIANGNIQKYEILSTFQLPDGSHTNTLKATVSISKLKSFCKNNGVEVQFNGSLFAANLKQQALNESSELIAVKNICNVSWEVLSRSLEYKLNVGEIPKLLDKDNQIYLLPIQISASSNENKKLFYDYFKKTLQNISLSNVEIDFYNTAKIPYYMFFFKHIDTINSAAKNRKSKNNVAYVEVIDSIVLRNYNSMKAIKNLLLKVNKFYFDFKLIANTDTCSLGNINHKYRLGESYYWDNGLEYRKDKFFIVKGDPLIKISSVPDMYPYHIENRANPIYLFSRILQDQYFDVEQTFSKNLWTSNIQDLLHHFNRDDMNLSWFAPSNPIYIDAFKHSFLDIYIEKTFTINQLDNIDNIKLEPILKK